MRSLGLIEQGILQPGGVGQEMTLQDAYSGRYQESGILIQEQGLNLINACIRVLAWDILDWKVMTILCSASMLNHDESLISCSGCSQRKRRTGICLMQKED